MKHLTRSSVTLLNCQSCAQCGAAEFAMVSQVWTTDCLLDGICSVCWEKDTGTACINQTRLRFQPICDRLGQRVQDQFEIVPLIDGVIRSIILR
jgi:hypothetical protein